MSGGRKQARQVGGDATNSAVSASWLAQRPVWLRQIHPGGSHTQTRTAAVTARGSAAAGKVVMTLRAPTTASAAAEAAVPAGAGAPARERAAPLSLGPARDGALLVAAVTARVPATRPQWRSSVPSRLPASVATAGATTAHRALPTAGTGGTTPVAAQKRHASPSDRRPKRRRSSGNDRATVDAAASAGQTQSLPRPLGQPANAQLARETVADPQRPNGTAPAPPGGDASTGSDVGTASPALVAAAPLNLAQKELTAAALMLTRTLPSLIDPTRSSAAPRTQVARAPTASHARPRPPRGVPLPIPDPTTGHVLICLSSTPAAGARERLIVNYWAQQMATPCVLVANAPMALGGATGGGTRRSSSAVHPRQAVALAQLSAALHAQPASPVLTHLGDPGCPWPDFAALRKSTLVWPPGVDRDLVDVDALCALRPWVVTPCEMFDQWRGRMGAVGRVAFAPTPVAIPMRVSVAASALPLLMHATGATAVTAVPQPDVATMAATEATSQSSPWAQWCARSADLCYVGGVSASSVASDVEGFCASAKLRSVSAGVSADRCSLWSNHHAEPASVAGEVQLRCKAVLLVARPQHDAWGLWCTEELLRALTADALCCVSSSCTVFRTHVIDRFVSPASARWDAVRRLVVDGPSDIVRLVSDATRDRHVWLEVLALQRSLAACIIASGAAARCNPCRQLQRGVDEAFESSGVRGAGAGDDATGRGVAGAGHGAQAGAE